MCWSVIKGHTTKYVEGRWISRKFPIFLPSSKRSMVSPGGRKGTILTFKSNFPLENNRKIISEFLWKKFVSENILQSNSTKNWPELPEKQRFSLQKPSKLYNRRWESKALCNFRGKSHLYSVAQRNI